MAREGIILSFGSFKPLRDPRHAIEFFQIIERHGGIFLPERVDAGRVRPYPAGDFTALQEIWTREVFILMRRRPVKVTISVLVSDELARQAGNPSDVWVDIDAPWLESGGSLEELLDLGQDLYDFLLPFYGYIALPWLRPRGATARIDLGFPGFGWATWLGPEFEQIIPVETLSGANLTRLDDGGRLVVLSQPSHLRDPDPAIVETHAKLESNVPEDVLQPPIGPVLHSLDELVRVLKTSELKRERARRPRLPKFRFIEIIPGEIRQKPSTQALTRYGPPGFTSTHKIRKILGPLEPKLIGDSSNVGAGGVVYFQDLHPKDAGKLLELLPPHQADDALESSPTFRQFVDLGGQYPYLRFFGYRVVPEREDERITIEGLICPRTELSRSFVSQLRRDYPRPEYARLETHEGKRYLIVRWA